MRLQVYRPTDRLFGATDIEIDLRQGSWTPVGRVRGVSCNARLSIMHVSLVNVE